MKKENQLRRRSEGPVDDDECVVLYSKENVAVHPSSNERINGQLRLIKQGYSVFLTWIPDKQKSVTPRAAERDRNLYTIRAVSLAEMKSIRRHTPAFGWQYIIVVLTNGLAFPPLYFHNGGIREFLVTLREHSLLVRAGADPNVYLVNDIEDPLQKSLASLDLAPQSLLSPRKEDVAESSNASNESSPLIQRNSQRDPTVDFSLHVLEKFSMVTKFARETTAHFMNGLENNKQPDIVTMEDISDVIGGEKVAEEVATGHQKDGQASTDVGIFEIVNDTQEDAPATRVIGRLPPLETTEWKEFLDAEGRVMDPKALRRRVFYGGVDPTLRPFVWKFLLEFFPFSSTYKEREVLLENRRQDYEVLKRQWQAKNFSKYRERKSRIEKDVVRTDRSTEFYAGDDNPNVDVLRDILMTYSFYNFDLGYCQGMSDLLAPIYYVMRDEAEAFWSFAALMERLGPNFHRDQNGMHSQLQALSKLVQLMDRPLHEYFKQVDCLNFFFCFRWILIQFKREFPFEDVLRLWEVLWSRHVSEHFHLYVCVAILKRYRRKIMDEQMEADSLLKFINELSSHIDLEPTLRDAELLCTLAGNEGLACIPPGTPPTLPSNK